MSNDTSTEFNEREIEVFSGDERQPAMLRWSAEPRATRDYWVELSGPNGPIEVIERDLFGALIAIRNALALDGWRIAVQGSRRDSWASGMIRDTIGAERVYILEFGRPMRRQDLVPIFAPADPVDIGTPEEQRANYFAWRAATET